MIYAYIGAMLAAVLLIVLAVLAIILLARAVEYSVRRRTAAVAEDYGEQLEILAREFRQQKAQQAPPAGQETAAVKAEPPAARGGARIGMQLVSRLADTRYRDSAVGQLYRQIRSGFHFAVEDAWQRIPPEQRTKTDSAACRAARELQVDTVCAMASLEPQQQYELLHTSGGADIAAMLTEYAVRPEAFSCIGFYDYLRRRAAEEAGGCTLYVPPDAEPDSVPDGVTVRQDPGLCEGFLLETAGTVYDYSLRVREIS